MEFVRMKLFYQMTAFSDYTEYMTACAQCYYKNPQETVYLDFNVLEESNYEKIRMALRDTAQFEELSKSVDKFVKQYRESREYAIHPLLGQVTTITFERL